MLDEKTRALLGDREAQERLAERGELLMCQRCGGIPKKKEFKGANFLYFECECGNQTLCYESEYEAILSWNTRIPVLSSEQIKHMEE